MTRMLEDYIDRFYMKEAKRSKLLVANNFAKAKEIAAWKEDIASKWNSIEITSVNLPEGLLYSPHVGQEYPIEVVIDHKDLPNCIGVELVVTPIEDGVMKPYIVQELQIVKTKVPNIL